MQLLSTTKRTRQRNPRTIAILRLVLISVAVLNAGAEEPTFHGQIGRMAQDKCLPCHHEGGIARLDFSDYEVMHLYRSLIRDYVTTGVMPPWNAAPLEAQGYPPGQGFLPDNSLTQEQIDLFVEWIDRGAPEGEVADAPPPRVFTSDWFLGEPEVVLDMPVEWVHPPGPDRYRCFILEPTPADALDVDRIVTGIQVKPGSSAVHHVDLYVVDRDLAIAAQAEDTATPDVPNDGWDCFGDAGVGGYVFFGYAPGSDTASLLRDDLGSVLPSGKALVLQVHYHIDEFAPAHDRTQVGLDFGIDASIPLVEFSAPTHFPGVTNPAVSGPASTRRDEEGRLGYGPMLPGETNSYNLQKYVEEDSHLLALWPHMHLTGVEMRVTAILPDQEVVPLLYLDKWDFDWQLIYNFKRPIPLPAGTFINCDSTFYNHTEDPILGGLFSYDEMITLGVGLTVDSHAVPAPRDSVPPAVAGDMEVLARGSALRLTIPFSEAIAAPHYPSAFEITGPDGRVAAPDTVRVSGTSLIIEYGDPDAAPGAGEESPVPHTLTLRGFFGMRDIAGTYFDGNGNGEGSELADDVVIPFQWAGLGRQIQEPDGVGCAAGTGTSTGERGWREFIAVAAFLCVSFVAMGRRLRGGDFIGG